MADTVFEVEVGAKYSVSTQKLKTDIQNILNDISKTPPTVTVGLAKTSSKRQINADLNELFKDTGKTQYGITLGLKGGGNIRGSTGKAITKDLLAITSTLSQQQAAKVTVHIDTAATQKAMLAELKKLDLGVAITANGDSDTGGSAKQSAKDQTEYNAAVREAVRLTAEAATLEKQALSKGAEGAAERRRQAAENRASAESVRDAYLQTAEAAKNGVTAPGFDKEVQGHHQVTSAIRARTAAEKDLLDTQKKASDSSSTRADAQQAKAIDSAKAKIQTLIGRLNMSSSAGVEAKAKFEALSRSFDGTKLSAAQMNEQIRNAEKAAKDAGAMAETAGEKFSRMLGTKIGYAAVGLLLNQVRNGLRQVYANVVELDTGMTELKKVTDETDETYQKFLDNAASRAKTLGSTMSNVVNATASFARLGYSLSEASELADAAVVYAHVGDEVESIDDASNSVISTMQAFGVEADNVMSIVDKFNTIGKQNCPAA